MATRDEAEPDKRARAVRDRADAFVSDMPLRKIEPSKGWVSLKLGELWEYRELLYFLTWRDIKVRYKQTFLGAAWAILQPFLLMVVFTFVGGLADLSSGGVPRPIFTFAALVPWTFFENGLIQSSNSLVGSANLITKVYFPRLTIPISAVLSGIVDFGIALVVLVGMMVFFGIAPTGNVIFLPVFLLLALAASLAVGLWLSAMNVQFRDVKYIVPFLTKFLLLATPIANVAGVLDQPWRTLYGLNPLVGVVEGFRWALLGTPPPGSETVASAITTVLLLLGGAFYFRRMEKSFADIV